MGYSFVDGNSDYEKELEKFLSDDLSSLMEVLVDPLALTR